MSAEIIPFPVKQPQTFILHAPMLTRPIKFPNLAEARQALKRIGDYGYITGPGLEPPREFVKI